MWQSWVQATGSVVLLFGLMFACLYRFGKRRSQYFHEFMSYNDVLHLVLLAMLFGLGVLSSHSLVLILASTLFFVLSAILNINSNLRKMIGNRVSISNVILAFRERDSLSSTASATLAQLPWIDFLVFPVVFTVGYIAIVAEHSLWPFVLPALISITAYKFSKSRLTKVTLLPWLTAYALLYIGIKTLLPSHVVIPGSVDLSIMAAVMFGTAGLGIYKHTWATHPFFIGRSVLQHTLTVRPIRPRTSIHFSADDRAIIDIPEHTTRASAWHGVCKDSNVILITMEALSSDYMSYYNPAGVALPYFNRLAGTAWVSDRHIVICPNTNSSFYTLYHSQYYRPQPRSLLKVLKAANYHSCFFSSSPLTDRTQHLLSELGFDSVYCRHQITRDSQALDKDVFSELLQHYANTIKSHDPYFVHIKNEQSHPPYAADAAYARAAPFDRFRHNIVEFDQILPDIVGALSGNGRDTLIIYTGDHGQSFGEYGYYCHSTSIIRQQTEVPFLIHHPKLRHRKIARSSHFDCLPTLCDLLGVPIRRAVIGHSLGHEAIPFSHVVYSESYCGNLPTCFGHINEDRKLMVDLNFNRYLLLDHQDVVIERLDAEQIQHSKQVLYAALQQRGLVDRPIGALL